MMEKTKRKEDRENRKKVRLVKKRLWKRTFRPADYSSSEEEELAVPLADSSDYEEDFEDVPLTVDNLKLVISLL